MDLLQTSMVLIKIQLSLGKGMQLLYAMLEALDKLAKTAQSQLSLKGQVLD